MFKVILYLLMAIAVCESANCQNVKIIEFTYSDPMILDGVTKVNVKIVRSGNEAIAFLNKWKGGVKTLAQLERIEMEIMESKSPQDSLKFTQQRKELNQKYHKEMKRNLTIEQFDDLVEAILRVDQKQIIKTDTLRFYDGTSWSLYVTAENGGYGLSIRSPYFKTSSRGLEDFVFAVDKILRTVEVTRKSFRFK